MGSHDSDRAKHLRIVKGPGQKASKPWPPGSLFWGGLPVTASIATQHFLVAGATGSGKTATLDLLLLSALSTLSVGSDVRILIYDAKGESFSKLQAMGAPCPVDLIQPFDRRGVAWDIARDVRTPADIHQVTALLFPQRPQAHQPFFDESAAALFRGVLTSLDRAAPGRWTLRDALLSMKSKQRLREVLALAREENAGRLELYFSNESTSNDIMSTIANRIEEYETVAAFWDEAPERVSLEDWVRGERVLILGDSHRSPVALKAILRAMFQRATQLILDQPLSKTRRTWVFLDEVSKAGKLEGLDQLFNKGRSFGACIAIGFQDFAGLEEVYGPKVAQEITAQVSTKAVLRLENAESAKWAEGVFGYREQLWPEKSSSWSMNDLGVSVTRNRSDRKETAPVVMGSMFLSIPLLDPPSVPGLGGFYRIPGIGTYPWDLPLELLKKTLPREPNDPESFALVPRNGGRLRPWTEEEAMKLGLKPRAPQTPEGKKVLRFPKEGSRLSGESEPPPPRDRKTPPRPAETKPARPRLEDLTDGLPFRKLPNRKPDGER